MNRLTAQVGVFGIGALLWTTAALVRQQDAPAPMAPAHRPFDPAETERAVAFLEMRERQDPQGAVAIGMLAQAYLARAAATGDESDLVRAEAAARRSLDIRERGNAAALAALAKSQMSRHRFAVGLALADRLTAQGERDQADRIRAECLLETGRYDRAALALGRLLARQPDDPTATTLRARLWEIDGQPERALGLYRQALERVETNFDATGPTLAWFRGRVAQCLDTMGRRDEARTLWLSALDVFPGNSRAMLAIAKEDACRGAWEEAIEGAQRAERTAPSQEAAVLLHDAYAATGRRADAEAQTRRLREGGLAHQHGRTLALFLADQGIDLETAAALAEQDRMQRPDIYARDALAWVRFRQGRIDEAAHEIEKALARGTRDPALHYHAGRIAWERGDRTTARHHLETALAMDPSFHWSAAPEARRLLAER